MKHYSASITIIAFADNVCKEFSTSAAVIMLAQVS